MRRRPLFAAEQDKWLEGPDTFGGAVDDMTHILCRPWVEVGCTLGSSGARFAVPAKGLGSRDVYGSVLGVDLVISLLIAGVASA